MNNKTGNNEELLRRILAAVDSWLDKRVSFTSPLIDVQSSDGQRHRYYITCSRVNKNNILFQEVILSADGENRVFRCWTFRRERQWEVGSLEKNGEHIYLRNLNTELRDLDRRIDLIFHRLSPSGYYYPDEIDSIRSRIEVTEEDLPRRTPLSRMKSYIERRILRPQIYVPILSGIIVVLGFIVGAYMLEVNRIQRSIDSTIDEYVLRVREDLQNIDSFMKSAGGELDYLKRDLQKQQSSFQVNRHYAYVNVMRLAEELTMYTPARIEAYKLIANNIQDAVSYGEIFYEMARLPSEEYQARILLATDRRKIVPLGRFEPVFKEMVYPVQVDSENNDGMGFRITSGYTDKREDPFGTGGTSPHHAVDIMNVSNIEYINYAGEIIREGLPSGSVVSAYEGVVKEIGYDRAYGWYIEIEHPLAREIKQKFPAAQSWSTFYAHMEARPVLNRDSWVERGAHIGEIGNSGKSTGPHLHFEVRVYSPTGKSYGKSGKRFDKLDPFPPLKKK